MDKEAIKHPAHYAYSKYEPVKVIREWGLNFNLGNVIKYVARAGRKDDILQDLKKARQYLDFEIEALEEEKCVWIGHFKQGQQEYFTCSNCGYESDMPSQYCAGCFKKMGD